MTNRHGRRRRHRRHKAKTVERGKLMRGAQLSALYGDGIRVTLRWVPLEEWLGRKREKKNSSFSFSSRQMPNLDL